MYHQSCDHDNRLTRHSTPVVHDVCVFLRFVRRTIVPTLLPSHFNFSSIASSFSTAAVVATAATTACNNDHHQKYLTNGAHCTTQWSLHNQWFLSRACMQWTICLINCFIFVMTLSHRIFFRVMAISEEMHTQHQRKMKETKVNSFMKYKVNNGHVNSKCRKLFYRRASIWIGHILNIKLNRWETTSSSLSGFHIKWNFITLNELQRVAEFSYMNSSMPFLCIDMRVQFSNDLYFQTKALDMHRRKQANRQTECVA